MCVLVTFYERGHFVMLIIKSMHLINLHLRTYLLFSNLASGDSDRRASCRTQATDFWRQIKRPQLFKFFPLSI